MVDLRGARRTASCEPTNLVGVDVHHREGALRLVGRSRTPRDPQRSHMVNQWAGWLIAAREVEAPLRLQCLGEEATQAT